MSEVEVAVVIGWIILIPLTVGISDVKGLSWATWLVATIFLGPAAFLVMLVLPVDRDGVDERLVRQGRRVRCGWCVETIHDDASVCPHCRRKVLQ